MLREEHQHKIKSKINFIIASTVFQYIFPISDPVISSKGVYADSTNKFTLVLYNLEKLLYNQFMYETKF